MRDNHRRMTRSLHPRRARPAIREGLGRLLLGLTLLWPAALPAQTATNELQALQVAKRAFSDAVYDVAERQFAEFALTFPRSPQVPEAILFQAQAALQQRKVDAALAVLTAQFTNAGALADQYRYWQGKAHLEAGNFAAAADTFAQLVRDFSGSVLLLEASYTEAEARFKLGQYPQVIQLLQRPEGTFQAAARVRANDELAARGRLLLAETLLLSRDPKAAEQTLRALGETNLVPEFKWRRQYLLCRVQLADGRSPEALDGTTNLLALATGAAQPGLVAESIALQADLLQRLGRFPAAAQAHERNLAEGVPAAYRRQALLHLIELSLAQGNIADAAQRLDEFLSRHPEDHAADLALLTLGELHLKLAATGAATNVSALATNVPAVTNRWLATTNHLLAARTYFEQLLTTHTNSPWVGKAHLNRGWCLWLEHKVPECLAAFLFATQSLPPSEDLAVARFKVADLQFQANDLTNAFQNYQSVVKDFAAFQRVRTGLVDQALYQLLRVSLTLGNLADAADAMKQILEGFPESEYRDRSILLVGQGYTQANQPAEARALFVELGRRIPNSPLVPELGLAIARTYIQEKNWAGAIGRYTEWLASFPTNSLRARAEFNRAWASYQAGQLTNAFALFTNFVAQFPQDTLAPRAQFWVATYYYDQKDFVNAEKNFQNNLLLQHTNFASQARMMAGRAAFARQGWKDAYDHFTAVVNDNEAVRTAPDLAAEAFFALGDTIVLQEPDPNKPIQKFVAAREAFSKIPQLFATNALVPRAWGRIGDCYLQMGSVDAKQYEGATNAYYRALTAPAADLATRSQAELGIGHALRFLARSRPEPEKSALLKAAFERYYQVVIEKNLRPGETPDPFWFKEAALNAGALAEESARWDVAIAIYQRLAAALPHLRPTLDVKIEQVRKQLLAQQP